MQDVAGTGPFFRPLVLGVMLVASLPGPAHADGDAMLGTSLFESGRGYGLTSAGVGLAGRNENAAMSEVVTEGTIELRGIPAGATVRHAYLYWVIFGGPDDPTVTLDGASVTGEVIGRESDTCWDGDDGDYFLADAPNVVYRADVTSAVDADGDFVIAGFPSFTATADTQGAALVVVWEDSSRDDFGTILLRDGAQVVDPTRGVEVPFTDLPELAPTAGFLHVGVGDGQVLLPDGQLRFNDSFVASPGGMQHFRGRNGSYWDSVVYDLLELDRLEGTGPESELTQEFGGDCLVFAYAALDIRSEGSVDIDAGTPDAGALDAGIVDGGSGLDASIADGGGADAGMRPDAGAPTTGTTGGCGCAVPRERDLSGAVWWVICTAALLARRRRTSPARATR